MDKKTAKKHRQAKDAAWRSATDSPREHGYIKEGAEKLADSFTGQSPKTGNTEFDQAWEDSNEIDAIDAAINERESIRPTSQVELDSRDRALAELQDKRAQLQAEWNSSSKAATLSTPPEASADASAGVESAAPQPLTTGDIAYCFNGLRWNEKTWKKPLGDKPKWLQACIAIPGRRGVSETRWDPVLIGAALVHNGHAKEKSVRAKFQTMTQLSPWLDAWKTYEADHFAIK